MMKSDDSGQKTQESQMTVVRRRRSEDTRKLDGVVRRQRSKDTRKSDGMVRRQRSEDTRKSDGMVRRHAKVG